MFSQPLEKQLETQSTYTRPESGARYWYPSCISEKWAHSQTLSERLCANHKYQPINLLFCNKILIIVYSFLFTLLPYTYNFISLAFRLCSELIFICTAMRIFIKLTNSSAIILLSAKFTWNNYIPRYILPPLPTPKYKLWKINKYVQQMGKWPTPRTVTFWNANMDHRVP